MPEIPCTASPGTRQALKSSTSTNATLTNIKKTLFGFRKINNHSEPKAPNNTIMKAICFYFQIHQPFRLKRYRFFDIGNDHYYYDDFANDDIVSRIASRSYIPAAESLLSMIEKYPDFRCAISVTGTALEQFEQYVPEFIDLLKKLEIGRAHV